MIGKVVHLTEKTICNWVFSIALQSQIKVTPNYLFMRSDIFGTSFTYIPKII